MHKVRAARGLVVMLAFVLAACHEPITQSRPRDCIQAWNARENADNRDRVRRADEGVLYVTVSRWSVDHPAPEFTGTGCSYLFYDADRYFSFSAAWRKDGGIHWQDAITQSGLRSPEQNLQPPNAALAEEATLVGGGNTP